MSAPAKPKDRRPGTVTARNRERREPTAGALSVATAPMEARVAAELPEGQGWQFEPKWDGFRCLAFRNGDNVDLRGKSGKSLARYFPEIVAALGGLDADRFVLDGELAIPIGSTLSFDALQARLHPAESRIRRLAAETPAIVILFDILEAPDGTRLVDRPLKDRRAALERFFASVPSPSVFRLSPFTREMRVARKWLARAGGSLDGVVAKRVDEGYRSGERAMLKIKNQRTADCVVGGFRYAESSRKVGSLLLGLYNESGLLDHVGFTSGLATLDRGKLTRILEKLRGGSGFTGDAPGGPSRWSTERSAEWVPLKPELVAEIRYDHVTGDRFRHGTGFLRWRPDKAPRQCTFDQLETEARPANLIAKILRP
jgi:ATP-dependent DNA ligase